MKKMNGVADPNRCQAVLSNVGQCQNKACTDSKYCEGHGGVAGARKAEKKRIKMYQTAVWQETIGRFQDHKDLKSLRSEIGVTRMLLEKRLNQCKTDTDLLLYSGPIMTLTEQLRRLIDSCHKIDKTTGQLLDKQALLNFATQVVGIITDELSDLPDFDIRADRVSDLIIAALQSGES